MGNRTGACATPPVEGNDNCVPATPSASRGGQGLGNPMGKTDGLPRKIADSDPLPEEMVPALRSAGRVEAKPVAPRLRVPQPEPLLGASRLGAFLPKRIADHQDSLRS